jgi:hypothetical protein
MCVCDMTIAAFDFRFWFVQMIVSPPPLSFSIPSYENCGSRPVRLRWQEEERTKNRPRRIVKRTRDVALPCPQKPQYGKMRSNQIIKQPSEISFDKIPYLRRSHQSCC